MTRAAPSLADQSDDVEQSLYRAATGPAQVCVVEAPPGSGKTRLLTRVAVRLCSKARLLIAVSCQTNSQADDVCRRLVDLNSSIPVVPLALVRAGVDLNDHWGFDLPVGWMQGNTNEFGYGYTTEYPTLEAVYRSLPP